MNVNKKENIMNLNENELYRLKAMLEDYKQSNGSVSITTGESINCSSSCAGYCSGTCKNFCIYTCVDNCGGTVSICWKRR